MTNQRVLMIFVLALLASPGLAELSPEHLKWGKSGVQLFMDEEEQAQWKTMSDDVNAELFIEAFWARRDPSPGTPENEFRAEIESRIRSADEQFGRTKGVPTDRGKAFILFGAPDEIRTGLPSGPRGRVGFNDWDPRLSRDDQGVAGAAFSHPLRSRWEIWMYRGKEAARMGFAKPVALFFADGRFARFHAYDLRVARETVVRGAITQPGAPPVLRDRDR